MTVELKTLCVQCVNMNHGFDGEKVNKHSCEAYGICDECRRGDQVATYRITQASGERD